MLQHSLTFTEGTAGDEEEEAMDDQRADLFHKSWMERLDDRALNFQGYLPNLAPFYRPEDETKKPSQPVKLKQRTRGSSSTRAPSATSIDDMLLPEVRDCPVLPALALPSLTPLPN